ncbi:MAG: hypothetical protein Q8L62_05590 [Candidatus Nitrotoga sp.]|nr:hypothetical protein [Candidatus Nitrotoga sp.]
MHVLERVSRAAGARDSPAVIYLWDVVMDAVLSEFSYTSLT